MPFFYYDPKYLLYVLLPTMALTALVQLYLKITYAKFSQVGTASGLTGAQAAREILDRAGLHDVPVEEVDGFLSDHYDPRGRVLRLSPGNYQGRSIAAIGVSAHEAGHALQHAQNYAPLKLRSVAVPLASIGSGLGYLALGIGFAMHFYGLALVGLICLLGLLVFELITLPVEFDASRRALTILPTTGLLTLEETRGARKVLVAAALTYVAAVVATLWTVLYYAIRLGLIGGGRRDD
jgi:Zn-dependent membrane protease YugP